MIRPRRHFTAEYKREAVAMVRDSERPLSAIARDLGVTPKLLGRWVREQKAREASPSDATEEEVVRLRREVARLKQETDFFTKSGGVLCEGRQVKYRCIAANANDFPITMMCRLLNVGRSGYYAWLSRRRPSARDRQNHELGQRIKAIHRASRGVYGSPKIRRELLRQGIRVSRHRIARLMRELGLKGIPRKRFRHVPKARWGFTPVPDLLGRDFSADAPNQRWVADITQINTAEGPLYLAAVMDLYSRAIVGWSMHHRIEGDLVVKATQAALTSRQPPPGLIHHSDRGGQYFTQTLVDLVERYGVRRSMGRTGSCYDNAAMESWFGLLKRERIRGRRYVTRDEARRDVFDYIETYYNRQRIHSSNGGMSPIEYELNAP